MEQTFKEVAIQAAKAAAAIHVKYFTSDLEVKTKEKSFDRVTIADLDAEKEIISIIKGRFPEHNFLAEEEQYQKTESEYLWVIDPLDGTNNFSHGMPIFSVSIALAKEGELILGVVYDVTRDELFTAEKGKGAFLNDQKIHVTEVAELNQALLITGFYYDRGKEMVENLEKIKQFFQANIIGLRRLGAASLDLCYVACGRASGFWEFQLSPWDFAAGKIIVEEAGGKVTGRTGEEAPLKKGFIVTSNGHIHDKMLAVLKD